MARGFQGREGLFALGSIVPLIPLIAALLLPLVFVVAIPFGLVQRYRLGRARRRARKWVATLNFVMITLSLALFLYASAITNFWVPKAFLYSLVGCFGGAILGLLGLTLTRWEETPRTLYYTPNQWLILFLTLTVTARLLYGFWRGWQAWGADRSDASWLAASGAAGSLAVGALVLGYYLAYTAGVHRRLGRHRKQWGQVIS